MAEQTPLNLNIQKIYLKDVSFESPQSPQVFGDEWKPEANVQVNTQAKKLGDTQYEAELTVTATVKQADKVVYLAEVKQACVVQTNAEEQNLQKILLSYCPNMMFPYVQQTVATLSISGGFPVLTLQPINFDALLANSQQQEGQEAGASVN
ncbi:MAG: protein-export chaperone SecB [Pseudomonadota bacterium]|nr:protein-export chaperone SecB [Pseudomonadota bacterium]